MFTYLLKYVKIYMLKIPGGDSSNGYFSNAKINFAEND